MVNFLGKFLIGVLTGLAAIAIACSIFLGWRLSRGPIALDFLTPYLESTLNDNTLGLSVRLGRTVLDWSDMTPTLPVSVLQVRLLDRKGQEVATIPRLSLRLGVRALVQGRVAPRAIELIGPKLVLALRRDGTIVLDGDVISNPHTPDMGRTILEILDGSANSGSALGSLKRLSVRDAELSLADERTGVSWRSDRLSLDLGRDRTGLTGSFDLPLRAGALATRLTGSGAYNSQTSSGRARIDFTPIDPSLSPAGYPTFDALRGVHMPVGGQVVLEYSTDKAPMTVRVSLTAGPGTVVIPDQYPKPVHLDGISLNADYDFSARRVTIDQFRLRREQTGIEAHGRLEFGAAGWKPALDLQGSAHDLPLNTLIVLWPRGISSGGLEWVAESIKAARIPTGDFRVVLPREAWSSTHLPENAVKVNFRLEGVTAHYLGDLPPLSNASGNASMSTDVLRIAIDKGAVDVPDDGRLNVRDGTVVLQPLQEEDKTVDIAFGVQGPAKAVVGLLDMKPLGYATEFGIAPSDIEGAINGRAHLRMPTKKDLLLREIEFDGEFGLRQFGVTKLVGDLPLRNGDMRLKLTQQAITGAGTGDLAGAPATIGWVQQLTPAAVPTRFTVRTRLTQDGAKALGIDLAPFVTGPLDLDARLEGTGAHISGGTLNADLGPAALSVEPLNWQKKAGEPATATLRFRQAGQQLVVDRFEATGSGLEATGRGVFRAGGGLDTLVLDHLRLGAATGMGGSLRMANGVWLIQGHAKNLDAARMLQDWMKSTESKPLPPFHITDLRFGQLDVAEGARLTDVIASARGDGVHINHLDLRGRLPEKGEMLLRIAPSPDKVRHLTLTAPDAGFVLSALGLTRNIRGGSIDATAELVPGAVGKGDTATGQANMRDFRVQGAPALAKVLTVASLTGLRDILQGQGITFDRLELPFEMTRDAVHLKDGRAVGSSLGITAHGVIDRKSKSLDITGTLAPIYTLNSLLGRLPVLGNLLLRGKEGVIAIRYSATGAMSDPRVSVNPLSVLTPGFLRGIFDLMGGSPKMPAVQDPPGAPSAPTAPATP